MRYHRYDGLPIRQVVQALLERLPASDRPLPAFDGTVRQARGGCAVSARPGRPGSLRVADVITALESSIMSQYSFMADVGDGWFIGLELRTEVFLAPGYYCLDGVRGPGALGGDGRPVTPAVGDRGRWRLPDDRDRAGDAWSIRGCGPSCCS